MVLSSDELYIPEETTVPYQCTPGRNEEVIATVLRKVCAGLSVFGSGFIVWTIWLKFRHDRSRIDPYCRIMLGLSLYDVIWSFFPWFMGSWLMPAETGHWGASGNTQTVSDDRSTHVLLTCPISNFPWSSHSCWLKTTGIYGS